MRLKPSKSLRSLRARSVVALATAVLAFTGLAVTATTQALADPTETLVAVGSDTIQDVYNQFSTDAAGNLLGSYNATNPVTGAAHEIITPVDGTAGKNCSFARPNGSGEGVANLRLALNPATTNGGAAVAPVAGAGCVDIGRSSSGPGTLQSNTGPVVYVPFALDAVAGATGPTTCTPTTLCPSFTANLVDKTTGAVTQVTATPVPTNITTADSFTFADLQTLYANCGTVTEGGITYNPGTATAGQQQIDLYIPQSGSGTRNFWASTLGFNATTPPTCDHDTIVGGALATMATGNNLVEEHDGTVYATDPNGFGPFSIAQWISQRNGHNDRRHDAILHNLTPTGSTTPVSPFSNGNPATGSLNANFPITRDVYSVVSFTRVTTASDPLFGLLNGTGSIVCQDSIQIISYGFALLPTTCGEVVATLRAQG
jgi:ABC-type phosphate transport system substrate-binding protein